MAKDPGRFDLEDVGWEEPDDIDPYTFDMSREATVGTITGFAVGLVLGLGGVALAFATGVGMWWYAAVASLLAGTAFGAIAGKIIEVRNARRRRARRAKLEEKEAKRKKKGPREVHDDDYRG